MSAFCGFRRWSQSRTPADRRGPIPRRTSVSGPIRRSVVEPQPSAAEWLAKYQVLLAQVVNPLQFPSIHPPENGDPQPANVFTRPFGITCGLR